MRFHLISFPNEWGAELKLTFESLYQKSGFHSISFPNE
jgi:hypothetical protein